MSVPQASDGHPARLGGVWTREKLIYVSKCSGAFMVAMAPKRAQGKWTNLVFLDLLCGPGIDIINGVEHRGSPLIALDTVPKFDRVFLGDKSKRHVDALRHRMAAEDASRVDLQVGDCHSRAEQIVQDLAGWGTLGLAFIDPEGF